jgi:hypothetical protein
MVNVPNIETFNCLYPKREEVVEKIGFTDEDALKPHGAMLGGFLLLPRLARDGGLR